MTANQYLVIVVSIFFLILVFKNIWNQRILSGILKQFQYVRSAIYLLGFGYKYLIKFEDYLTIVTNVTIDIKKPFVLHLGPIMLMATSNPEIIECILTKALSKGYGYKFLKPVLGNGLVTAPVHQWKENRKLLAPAFHQKLLDSFVPVFSDHSSTLVSALNQHVDKRELDIRPIFDEQCITALCETIFGYKNNTASNNYIEISKIIHRLKYLYFKRAKAIYVHPEFLYKLTNSYKEASHLAEKVHNKVKQIIANVKKDLNDGSFHKTCFETHRKTFIEIVLEKSKESEYFTEQQIIDEVFTSMAAGSDTTSATICYALTMIGMHPVVQEKIYEEVISIIGDSNSIEYSDLPKLKYLELTIKETMRLFPIAPNIFRKIDNDLLLPTGEILPNGCQVTLAIFAMQRSKLYYQDPLLFIPERFLPEELSKRHPYTLLGFSKGPRDCIAWKFGMMEMKTYIAEVVRRFKVHTHYKSVEEISLKQEVLLTPVNGFKVYFSNRVKN